MIDPIVKYFTAEKSESLIFITIGLMCVLLSVYFFFQTKGTFYKGIMIPLAGIAAIQLMVGSTIYFRSDHDIKNSIILIEKGHQEIKDSEIPRMELVMKNFKTYKWVEIAFVMIGTILIIIFSNYNFWKGLGVGMLAQGAIMLVLDIFAEKRGFEYLNWLKDL